MATRSSLSRRHSAATAAASADAVRHDDARNTDARTPTSHSHAQSDVTNLVSDLADKRPSDTPIFAGRATAAQTINNNSDTQIDLNTEDVDSHNGHSTGTNPGRWTCPSGWDGWYWVAGTVQIDGADITNIRMISLRKNGTYIPGSSLRALAAPTATLATRLGSPDVLVQLTAGDYVELYAYQNSGSNLPTVVSGTAPNGYAATLNITWVGEG